MTDVESETELIALLQKELEESLLDKFGPMLGGTALVKVLGYPSDGAFRMSLARGQVPVTLFNVEHRRGKFALTKDVSRFIAEQRYTRISDAVMGGGFNVVMN